MTPQLLPTGGDGAGPAAGRARGGADPAAAGAEEDAAAAGGALRPGQIHPSGQRQGSRRGSAHAAFCPGRPALLLAGPQRKRAPFALPPVEVPCWLQAPHSTSPLGFWAEPPSQAAWPVWGLLGASVPPSIRQEPRGIGCFLVGGGADWPSFRRAGWAEACVHILGRPALPRPCGSFANLRPEERGGGSASCQPPCLSGLWALALHGAWPSRHVPSLTGALLSTRRVTPPSPSQPLLMQGA